jgi:histidine phosphotransferase ChpT
MTQSLDRSDRIDLAALLGSRICHDLISPIGAIGNGLELLMMDLGAKSPEMALIAQSVANANARIRFFRLAFGAAGDAGKQSLAEVRTILSDLTQGSRQTIEWATGPDLGRAQVKIAFLLLMCLESAMPYGGRVSVGERAGRWTIEAAAQRFRIDEGLWAMLADPSAAPDISPAAVHFPLAAAELARQGRRLQAELGQATIRLSF